MSENGKTHMIWKVSFRMDKYIMTTVEAMPGETAEDIENRHLVAQTVQVAEAQEQLIAHLQYEGIAASDVRIVAVTTEESVTA